MTVKDRQGLELSGATAAAGALYRDAVGEYHCYAGAPFPRLRAALADSPGFVMAHVLKAYMTLVGTDPSTRSLGVQAVQVAKSLATNTREAGHVVAQAPMADEFEIWRKTHVGLGEADVA